MYSSVFVAQKDILKPKMSSCVITVPEADNKAVERPNRKKGSGADGDKDGAENDDEPNQAEIEKVTHHS